MKHENEVSPDLKIIHTRELKSLSDEAKAEKENLKTHRWWEFQLRKDKLKCQREKAKKKKIMK